MEISPLPEAEMEHLVTPFFRHQTIENVPQSEIKRAPVLEVHEVVELRFAGDKNYSPVLPVTAMYRRNGHNVITYAERFADQYRAFQEGRGQEAEGTPLEMLRPYGIADAQLSLCRALKIYSIEALHRIEGPSIKNLGMNANDLKCMAEAYMADRLRGGDAAAEIAKLRAEIEALTGKQTLPEVEPTREEMESAIAAADADFEAMTDADLKALIQAKTGQAPRGTPSRDFLLSAARELAA